MDYILTTNQLRVLAIDPSTKGIGFAVLEGPERLIDWGVRQAAADQDDAKNAECAKIVAELIDRSRPRILTLEDAAADDSRRCERVEKLLAAIRQLAREKRVKVLDFTPERVRKAFAPTKDVIAAAIAGRFPELGPRLPRPRTLTMSEQYEMPVFDAMAFALTYFYFKHGKQLSEERKLIKSAFHYSADSQYDAEQC